MKINVGLQGNKKSRFDFTHDVNTTSDIGFVQPLVKQLCVGGSKLSVSVGTFCRLNPIVAPSFGRYIIKHTACFVPMDDIYMPYANLIAATPYNGAGNTYTPVQTPTITVASLFGYILNHSTISTFTDDNSSGSNNHRLELASTPVHEKIVENYLKTTYNVRTFDFEYRSEFVTWPEGADFVISIPNGSSVLRVCIKMKKRAKNLFKIFTGLGYVVGPEVTGAVNALPIFAYYKAWFDTYCPKQTLSWQGTKCYEIIKHYEYNILRAAYMPGSWDTEHKEKFYSFIDELADCYYVCDPDWFTAHIDTTAKGPGVSIVTTDSDGTINPAIALANQQPGSSENPSNPVVQKALQKLLTYVNTNTILGQSITRYFKVHGLGGVDDNKLSSVIEGFNQSVDIDDIYASSDYQDQHLGDFAGRATSSGKTGKIVKDCKRPGYFIILTCIIPRTGYYQGVDYDLLCNGRFDYYTPEFDSLSFEASPKQLYIGNSDVKLTERSAGFQQTFGFIPRYAGFKFKNNKVNGDFRVRSLRNALMPYYLDRHVNLAEIQPVGGDETETTRSYFLTETESIPQVSPALRFLGNSEYFGNFDRIFYDSGAIGNAQAALSTDDPLDDLPLEDNFMLHNVVSMDYFAPMLPLKDSFDTDSFGKSTAEEKA